MYSKDLYPSYNGRHLFNTDHYLFHSDLHNYNTDLYMHNNRPLSYIDFYNSNL